MPYGAPAPSRSPEAPEGGFPRFLTKAAFLALGVSLVVTASLAYIASQGRSHLLPWLAGSALVLLVAAGFLFHTTAAWGWSRVWREASAVPADSGEAEAKLEALSRSPLRLSLYLWGGVLALVGAAALWYADVKFRYAAKVLILGVGLLIAWWRARRRAAARGEA